MATLLTSVSTPFGSESCKSCSSEGSAEVPLREALAGGRGGSGAGAMMFGACNQQSTVLPEPGRPLDDFSAKATTPASPQRTASFATICEPQAMGA